MADASVSPLTSSTSTTSSLTGGGKAAGEGAAASASENALATAAADFETFLALLTTQMRNQDPLNPMESTEFIAQLASFSAVEQQIQSNEKLDSVIAALGGGEAAGLADWIGMEAQAAAQTRFNGDPVEILVEPVEDATRAILVVSDEAGEDVARIPIDPAARSLSWDGAVAGGEASPGLYSFSVQYLSDDEFLGESPGMVFSRVKEVRLGPDSMLLLEGGVEISPDSVVGLREPEGELEG